MDLQAREKLAASLMGGITPAARPWEIAEAVTWICDAIGRRDAAVNLQGARKAANALKKLLVFEQTRRVASTWHDARGFDPTLEKLRAQALIELSALDAAEQVLNGAIAEARKIDAGVQAQVEMLEYEGLLGRVAKQRYVISGDLDDLAAATGRYLQQYLQPSRPYWHGINAVALVAREERERSPVAREQGSIALAEAVRQAVIDQWATNPGDEWLPGTASEACLALGRCDEAELWLYRLLFHPAASPFTINAYSRQLREIWGATANGTGGSCADRLAGIITRHQMHTEQRWAVTPTDFKALEASDAERTALEKNFSGQFGFSVEDVIQMLGVCKSIACITNSTGERLGTGFIIAGSWLKAAYGPGPVLVTNAHVISETLAGAIRPAQARATFELEPEENASRKAYAVEEVLISSPPDDGTTPGFDTTVVRLKGLERTSGELTAAASLPMLDAKTRAYVIGHPRGSGLQISLHDSLLLDIDDEERRVHYRTPTDPGSSGSPVFTSQWKVMAVHHSGSSNTRRLHGDGSYEANEGIALAALRRHLNA
jgi:hypothetical protein